jgi:hypothetical protein
MKATVNEMWSRAEIERLVEKCDKRGRSICSGGLALGEDGMLLSKAAAALGECLPDERVGRCWCERDYAGYVYHKQRAKWQSRSDCGVQYGGYCHYCGAHLGADGIARRNAAAGQVERVLEALGECEHAGRICLDSGIGQGGDSYLIWWCTQCGAVASDRREAGHDEWIKGGFLQVNTPQTTKAIRAALDGGAPDATHD